VAASLRVIPEPLRRTIERACTDMYEGFVRAIKEEVPWAEVVIDRFQVARAYRNRADMVRKKELKRLKRVLPKAAFAEITGAMWPFRKRPADLKPSEWELLERVFTYSPKVTTPPAQAGGFLRDARPGGPRFRVTPASPALNTQG
jgi:transposase